jgi:hypothetical protein
MHPDYQKNEADEARKLAQIKETNDFETLMTFPEARAFVNRLLEKCGVYQTSYNAEALDMAYREGKRSIGLWILSQFNQCPNLYIELLKDERTR